MADQVIVTQEMVEVAAHFTVPPEVVVTQEIVEVGYATSIDRVFVYQEVIEVACRGPYVHKYGPQVQDVG